MNYKQGVAAIALSGSIFSGTPGCASAPSSLAVASAGEKKSCRIGSVYGDLFMYEPKTVDQLGPADDVEGLIMGLKRRIVLISGPDTANDADTICTDTIERDFCTVLKSVGIINMADGFNLAVKKCYSGPVDGAGAPKGGDSGELDMDCFLRESIGKMDTEANPGPYEQCRNLVYDCYRTIYVTFRDKINGQK